MTEKELIFKIRELRQIKPREDWVSLTKSQILGQEPVAEIRFLHFPFLRFPLFKPAYAGLIVVFVVFGAFGFTQSSLPGDLLYPVKKIVERSQAIFVSEKGRSQASFELANKRLEELTKIAETNQVKKIAPALEEYQASVAQVTKDLVKVTATTSDPVVIRELAEMTQELEKNKEKLEQTYGIAGLEIKEGSNPTKVLVEWLINDLEKRTLTEEQSLLFETAKKNYEAGEFNESLEKLLFLSSPGSENSTTAGQ